MKQFFRVLFTILGMLSLADAAYSTTIPNTDSPSTFVGPTLKARLINRLVEDKAYSLAAEIGPYNLRASGTYTWKLTECQRLKLTAEYLWQGINYAYFSGNTNIWVNQMAGGLEWQLDLPYSMLAPQLDISAYFSHAPSKTLGTTQGSYINPQGISVAFTDERRVAGSNGKYISPSFSISPWRGGRLIASLNYDIVDYNTKFQVNDEDTSGLGGTLAFKQIFTDYLAAGVSAAVRQPFNNYHADLTFARLPFLGRWTVGVFGDYVVGKNTLPDTYNVGVNADFYMDQAHEDYNCNGCNSYCGRPCYFPVTDKLLAATATPAVYMPQVLAVHDNLTT